MSFYRLWTVLIVMTGFLAGCGERGEAPDPPRGRTRLALDFFSDLDRGDYRDALAKAKRLSELDPSDPTARDLQELAADNLTVLELSKALARGDLAAASTEIDRAIAERGNAPPLSDYRRDLNYIRETREIAAAARNAKDATALFVLSAKLNQIITEYKPAVVFKPFAERLTEQAKRMLEVEKSLAVNDLADELDAAWIEDPGRVDTLAALLFAEAPGDSVVVDYVQCLAPDWERAERPGTLRRFRQTAVFGPPEVRKARFAALAETLVPADTRTTFAKALAFGVADNDKDAQGLLTNLDHAFPSRPRFQESPKNAAAENNRAVSPNPFVILPFALYRSELYER